MEPLAGLSFSSSSTPETAWEDLVGRYGAGLKARVGNVLRRSGVPPRSEHVEEIVQEVYCRLLAGGCRRLRRCHATSEGQIGAFLGRVAERVALDQLRAARAQKRGGALASQEAASQRQERAVDPRANPEEQVLTRERFRLFLERCGALAGRRDYRRNARILALAVAGLSSVEIATAFGGALSPRSIDGLLLRVRRYVAAHALAAAGCLDQRPPAPAGRRSAARPAAVSGQGSRGL